VIVLKSLATAFTLVAFWFAFEFQYMWYPNADEAVLLRWNEAITILAAGLVMWKEKYILLYALLLTSFCIPIIFLNTVFNWALFGILLTVLAVHNVIYRLSSS